MKTARIIALVLVLVAAGAGAIYALDRRDGGDSTHDSDTGVFDESLSTPVVYGSFLVVPANWPDGVDNSYAGDPAGPLSATNDEESIKGHALHIEAPIAPGFSTTRRVHAKRVGDEIVEVRLSLEFEKTAIEIIRWKPALPFNVERAVEGGGRRFNVGLVGDAPAVFYFSDGPPASTSIWFIENEVLTQISGDLALENLMEIAELIR